MKLTRGQRRGLLRNARICGVRPCDKVYKALNCRYKEKYSRKSCRNEKGSICHDAVDIYGVVALASLPVLGVALIGSIIKNFYDCKDSDDDGNYYQLTFGFWWKFNQNRYWMANHGIFSTIAFYLWIKQLSDSSRAKSIWFHKIAGRVSLVLFVGSSFTTPIADEIWTAIALTSCW